MAKVIAKEVKARDFIETESGFKGVILKVHDYVKDVYLQMITEDGKLVSTYVKKDGEVNRKRRLKRHQKMIDDYMINQGLNNIGWIGGNLGSDPEIFVVNKTGEVIPSFKFLKGKDDPDRFMDAHKALKTRVVENMTNLPIFWDGFQAEFNTMNSGCLSWVVDSVFVGLKTLQEKARAYDKDARLTIRPTLDVPDHMLKEAKKEHVEFGCMPSFNAYGMEGLKQDGREVPFRSAGGHLHLGIGQRPKEEMEKYVKALDKILGVACVSLFAKYDDPKRRVLYGLAGEYRLPKHGLEYRTLSNVWMCHPVVMNMVFELARKVVGVASKDAIQYWNATEEETIKCINECDVELARDILKRNQKMLTKIIYAHVYDEKKAENLFKVYYHGVESLIENPDDVCGNWGLNGMFEGHNEGHGQKIGNIQGLAKYAELDKLTI